MKNVKLKGQAMIIILMVMAISTLLITQVVMMNINSIALASEFSDGDMLYRKAEGYLENAALRYLRNSNYTGELLLDGDISCTIVITDLGVGVADLQSTCEENGRSKIAGMQTVLAAGRFTFSPITER